MLDSLTNFVTVLLALSIASERLVELFKGMSSALTGPKPGTNAERWRQLKVHWMSLLASFVVVFLTQEYIIKALDLPRDTLFKELPLGPFLWVTFAILASGGSSMWNSILTYLLSLKNLKQQQVADTQKADNADLVKALPTSMP